jgi:hypothetical protein
MGRIELHWRFVCSGGVEFGRGYLKQLHGMRSNYLLLDQSGIVRCDTIGMYVVISR